MTHDATDAGSVDHAYVLSIVIPALNEQDNVEPLVTEVKRTIVDAGIATELIIVDDGSTDGTLPKLKVLMGEYDWLKVLHRDEPRGQSAAMHVGVQFARGTFIATLDADMQNDPGDLPRMLALLHEKNADMVQGDRSANRQDNIVRKITSRIGRMARKVVLNDAVRDTGCSARVVRGIYAKQWPLQFKGVHRFLPAYVNRLGGKVIEMPVHHRARHSGETKYGLGILSRGFSGFFDLFAVRWMFKRYRKWDAQMIQPDKDQS